MEETGYKKWSFLQEMVLDPVRRLAYALPRNIRGFRLPVVPNDIPRSRRDMKYFSGLKKSLVTRLVLAFVLVAVVPMLLASKITTALIAEVVNRNIERWLGEATDYMRHSVEETSEGLKAVSGLLDTRFDGKAALSGKELAALSYMEVDALWLKDAGGRLLYSNAPDDRIGEPLYPGAPFSWIGMADGTRRIAITYRREFTAKGEPRVLELASWFNINYSDSSSDGPVVLRIFLPDGDRFREAYSSAPAGKGRIPRSALRAVSEGAATVFIPEADWTDDIPGAHSLITAVRGGDGKVQALFVISAQLLPFRGWLEGPALFWGFFIFGTLLSAGIGCVLARKLVKPLRQLNEGVRGIAAGKLGCQLPVRGGDEIAELTSGFNIMVRQLEIMRHEGIQSARQERSRMLGEIALGFAHEIRNPLVVIKTSAEVVLASLTVKSREVRLLGFVVEEVARINNLISEFLSFAKPSPLKLEYFPLIPLLREIAEISSAEMERRGIRYAFSSEEADDRVLGERSQIRQVLLNLALNAMDAMPQGGTLSVRLYAEGGQARIEIRDTGVGIPPKLLPTIHMPFISTKKSGLGLGLSKAYAIIDEHGGSISCSSTVGEGTVFTVCLNR